MSNDELDQVDRILLGVCAALWLAALGAAVAAIVALVDLTGGHADSSGGSDTPLLIRARRSSLPSNQRPSVRAASARSGFGDPVEATTKLRTVGGAALRNPVAPASSRVGFPTAAVDQVWLRCWVVIAGAIGAATTLICVGTYLMATEHDTAAWAPYGVAALVTVAMPAAPVFFLRQLRTVLA
jgi:hypothetical protein